MSLSFTVPFVSYIQALLGEKILCAGPASNYLAFVLVYMGFRNQFLKHLGFFLLALPVYFYSRGAASCRTVSL